jgi:hypothetical protein
LRAKRPEIEMNGDVALAAHLAGGVRLAEGLEPV